MEIKTKARQWGNSIGFILPKSIVDIKKIRENDELIIDIKTFPITEDMFGKYPRNGNKTAQELKDEARNGWS